MRKDIREGVQKHMIDGIKPNYAALAKQYGCDYRTVKVAYHEALEGGKRPIQRKKRPSKLDPYKATNEILIAWIRKYKKIISSTFHKGCVRYY